MKKKILAMLLALVMVISLLPVSVFAAEAEGEHDHAHCPGEDENHTLANCAHAQKLTEVEGDCDSWGYTIYKCPECDVNFADKFVEPGEEGHDYEIVEEEVPADCLNDGKAAVEVCKECGKTKPGSGKVIPSEGNHNWVKYDAFFTTAEECTAKCSACGITKTQAKLGHDWEKKPTAIVKDENGMAIYAVYTCADCGKTKNVDIIHNHADDLVEHEAKDADCLNAGNETYFECKECKKFYMLDENKGLKEVEEGAWITEALDHDFEDEDCEIVEEVASTCDEAGYKVVKCLRCKETKKVDLEKAAHSYEPTPTFKQDATCTKYGFELYACIECGYVKEVKTQNKLGHTPYACPEHEEADEECAICADAALSINKVEVKAGCTKDGSLTWNCGRCQIEQSKKLDKIGHIEKTYTVPATCSSYGYTFKYCARGADCDAEVKFGFQTLVTEKLPEGATRAPRTQICVHALDAEGKLFTDTKWLLANLNDETYWVALLEDVKVDWDGGFDPDNHSEDINKTEIINQATCTEKGNKLIYCEDCTWSGIVEIPATEHKFDKDKEVVNTTPATCTKAEVIKVECQNGCGATKEFTGEPALDHDLSDKRDIPATCVADGKKDYQECLREGCNYEIWTGIIAKPTKEDLLQKKPFASFEEAEAVHARLGDAWNQLRKATCGITALYESAEPCADCGYYVVVEINEFSGHVVPDWTNMFGYGIYMAPGTSMIFDGVYYKAPKAATCLVDGNTAGYTCSRCGTAVESEVIKAAGKHEIEITKEAKAPTCTEAGWTEGSKCKNCDEVTVESLPLEALGHAMVCVDHGVLDCENYGYEHELCVRCGLEYIINYEDALGHDMEVVERPDCTTPGKKECANGCGEEEEIPANKHENEAGEKFDGTCNDDVEDRYCVVCEAEIPLAHNFADDLITRGEKTCISYAYILYTCADCGETLLFEDTIDGLGEHDWVPDEESEKFPTFHEDGECDWVCSFCGKYKETETVDALEGIGTILEVDNALVSGAELTDSGKLVVTLKLDANDVDLWGVKLGMIYESDVVKFTHAEFVSDLLTNGTANAVELDNDKLKVEADDLGIVWIVANAHNTDDKQAQNVNINAPHTLVKLYFDIVVGELPLEPEYEPMAMNPNYAPVYHSAFAVLYIEAVNAESDDLSMDIDDIMYHAQFGYNFATYTVVKFMDVNDDGVVNLADVLAVYNMITAVDAEYDARADVNKDGVVNAVDFTYMYKYLSYELSYEDMAALKPEA